MVKAVLFKIGTVEKRKVAPPSDVVGVIAADAVEETLKSEATPVVAPAADDTAMTQVIALPVL
jgi:hypothetical protein